MEEIKREQHDGLIAVAPKVVERLKPWIVLGLILEIALASINCNGSFDLPWQLAEGLSLWKNGGVVPSVIHAYGEISAHFQNEYVLYELWIAGIDRIIGWTGLCVFFSLLGFLIYLPCLLAFVRARTTFRLIDVCLVLLAQFIIGMLLTARPEIFADICYVVIGFMLTRCDARPWSARRTFCFGLVFCLWANAHGSFLIGGAMLAFWYAQLFLLHGKALRPAKNFHWLRPGLAAVIGCALNPYGVFRFVQPFQLHSLLWGQATSVEMWPVVPSLAFLPLAWAGTALLALLGRIRERPHYWMMALLVLLLVMTFGSIRYLSFIALTLLVIAWDGVVHCREKSWQEVPYAAAVGRLLAYPVLALCLIYFSCTLAQQKWAAIDAYRNSSNQLQITNSSAYSWLIEHPDGSRFFLSDYAGGSCAQMPGLKDLHPLMDSGSHRYSNRLMQLFYYTQFSPESFRLILSKLKINAVVVGNNNIYWASILNGDPDWHLAEIQSDSQLYLRGAATDSSRQLFFDWEASQRYGKPGPDDISARDIIRGLRLRSDADSLRLLVSTHDAGWMSDPQLAYIQDWLQQVPASQIEDALNAIGPRADNSANGLHLLFLLRLKQNEKATQIARAWTPSLFDENYQSLQQLRTEALLSAGDKEQARKLVNGLWPQPRFSLRWARLCRQLNDDPQSMPKNARLLSDLADTTAWQEQVIAALNENIERLSRADQDN